MNVALWIAQCLLAVAFIAAGGMKVFAYEKFKAQTEKGGKPAGITRGLAAVIGICELTGAVGVVLPRATNVAAFLTPWAATGLATIMILAVGFHVRRRESPAVPIVLFVLAAVTAFGRFSQWR